MIRSSYKRRGQSASNAAVTIIVIAVAIILYILFLSPTDRAELLGEDTGTGAEVPGAKQTLLSKTPGRINPMSANVIEHTIPSFIVFTVTNAEELKRTQSMYVKNSAFTDNEEQLVFFYEPQTTEDVKLSFNIGKAEGRLIIRLNNYKIYESEINTPSPDPISLPEDYLKPSKNTLTFSVSSPGAAFWRVNEYELENVLVSGKITDYSAALSEQHFSMADFEYENMEQAVLEFLPDCPPGDEGLVQILINNRVIYTGYPDCGIQTRIELSKQYLQPGDNVLVATTDSGSFLMDMPKVVVFLKETPLPVYYFSIPQDVHQSIFYGESGVVMTLRFADAGNLKQGELVINGYKTYFETQELAYQIFVEPDFLLPGSNAVKIIPHGEALHLAELRADLV